MGLASSPYSRHSSFTAVLLVTMTELRLVSMPLPLPQYRLMLVVLLVSMTELL
ncbi:uncharacterized protein PHALS_00830 [Plasmopara halstedii]|uniref:Uncharacterized protein n=1 Tax=Plasmopara halstedii TaxID=4781 RepID=A0A0P1ASR2_PLAHL|nr:uncharacterized protein PHALS_00830 [Plasmopara halstedii]CEG44466.1 hypothetical protein PHALS_00830 [Plasmopara halstedii]|eukprot:XP_024580835.1 hypothetical protein PHALS_00830 [Plasmopara halstedii]